MYNYIPASLSSCTRGGMAPCDAMAFLRSTLPCAMYARVSTSAEFHRKFIKFRKNFAGIASEFHEKVELKDPLKKRG